MYLLKDILKCHMLYFFAPVSLWWEIKFLLDRRLSCDTLLTRLTLPAKSVINWTRIREARLPSKSYDLGSNVYDVFKVSRLWLYYSVTSFFSIFEGFNLLFDQVLVQGMRDSNRSVSLYYLKTSTDNNTFIEVQEQGARKVTRKEVALSGTRNPPPHPLFYVCYLRVTWIFDCIILIQKRLGIKKINK